MNSLQRTDVQMLVWLYLMKFSLIITLKQTQVRAMAVLVRDKAC